MRVEEAINILKPQEGNKKAIRVAWVKKCKEFHPDKIGGQLELMQLINAAYDKLKIIDYDLTKYVNAELSGNNINLCEALLKVYDKIKYYTDCNIELIGSWLWISGNTKNHKDKLKELGFRWSPKKKAWAFHKGKHRSNKTPWNMNKIKKTYGCMKLETEDQPLFG